ncbi:carbohydrate-binding protein [Marinobacter salinisoli]|uniref:Carbohydrate-binding protein n=1 Tax=Marinobacter salinisoli TaxID=2769486 RepID=A0ABX7MT00_9GAMM|nr:carbohydrate-binding protein [Marinobacter salinisoli]QSP95446.1 carbohydrate-binding protein [Marinobacter salinisoli]
MSGIVARPSLLFALLAVVGLAMSPPVLAEPCDPDESAWDEARYYKAGTAVFHNNGWYVARQVSEGKEPGISFVWKAQDEVPECDSEQKAKQESAEATEPGQQPAAPAPGETAPGICERPEQWRFAAQYEPGNQVMHGGMVWEAIENTAGDMPGMDEPPLWQAVEDHCALKLSNDGL